MCTLIFYKNLNFLEFDISQGSLVRRIGSVVRLEQVGTPAKILFRCFTTELDEVSVRITTSA